MPISTSVFDPELIPKLWFDLDLGSWFDPDLTAPVVSDGSVHGNLTATLGALTVAGTGKVAVKGSGSSSLGALATTVKTGKVAVKGSAVITLGALVTSVKTGKVAVKGTGSNTLGALTTTVKVGKVAVKGSANRALGALTLSAAAHAAIHASLNQTLMPLTSLGVGRVKVRGALVATLADTFDESDKIHRGTTPAGKVIIL